MERKLFPDPGWGSALDVQSSCQWVLSTLRKGGAQWKEAMGGRVTGSQGPLGGVLGGRPSCPSQGERRNVWIWMGSYRRPVMLQPDLQGEGPRRDPGQCAVTPTSPGDRRRPGGEESGVIGPPRCFPGKSKCRPLRPLALLLTVLVLVFLG